MNQQQAEDVKDLAKPVVEVLPRIRERECPECEDRREAYPEYAKGPYLDCSTCSGTGKVKWKWEPKPSDIFEYTWKDVQSVPQPIKRKSVEPLADFQWIEYKELLVIPMKFDVWTDEDEKYMAFGEGGNYQTRRHYRLSKCIPILHWEEIERVLEGVGYIVHVDKQHCSITRPRRLGMGTHEYVSWQRLNKIRITSKSRQQAVMRAVIKLGEQINERNNN